MKKQTLPVLSEYQECLLLVDYLNILKAQGKIIAYTHIPNETYTTSWSVKRKNKALGVSSGFPDYIILTRDKIIFLEMKREKAGLISDKQIKWLLNLDSYDNTIARAAHGFKKAKKLIDEVLS